MDYQDSVERSAEYLRLALPLMSKQAAALSPVSYAVWYDYVSGRNAALKARIDELTRDGRPLDDDATKELFRRHVVDMDEELAHRVSQGFQKVMADVAKSAAEAGSDAGQFGHALEQWSAGLAQSPDAAAPGSTFDLTLQLTNNGSDAAADLLVSWAKVIPKSTGCARRWCARGRNRWPTV